jgi:hypothetical protein
MAAIAAPDAMKQDTAGITMSVHAAPKRFPLDASFMTFLLFIIHSSLMPQIVTATVI